MPSFESLKEIPSNIWEEVSRLIPGEKNTRYLPMEYLLQNIRTYVDQFGEFNGSVVFNDSKETLNFNCKPDNVLITSPDEIYKVDLRRIVYNPYTIEYGMNGLIRSKYRNKYHPNIFARSLFGSVLDYFNSDIDKQIRVFSSKWSLVEGYKDNYLAYINAEGSFNQKVWSTPTGKICLFHGFTQVRYLGENPLDGNMAVLFIKP